MSNVTNTSIELAGTISVLYVHDMLCFDLMIFIVLIMLI